MLTIVVRVSDKLTRNERTFPVTPTGTNIGK